MQNELIQNVSDTALWIAGFRALESERKDAVFNDHLARKLAGERGLDMVASTPETTKMAFAMVVRTTAIDRLIRSAINKGIETVINLGAGLDTRPYRMDLPAQLRWVEIDFPDMIHYKNDQLKNETPLCKLDRIAADLSQDEARKTLFDSLGSETRNALIITEGVIAYLTNKQAEELSKDLSRGSSFQYWIMDYAQGFFARNSYSRKLQKQLTRTPFQFSIKYPLKFFGDHGWKVEENIFILDEANRIGRKLPLTFPYNVLISLFPNKLRELGNETYGYAMFKRS